jgi:phage shock protein A
MATLLGKVKTLLSATLHSIVDRALQANSIEVFDDYIRQAERSMQAFKETMVDLGASIKTLKRKYDEAADDAAKLDFQVDELLKANKTTLARVTQDKLNHQTEIARVYQEQFQKQSATYQTLYDVVTVLQSKVDTLHSQRDQVAVLIQLVKTKKLAARSIHDVQTIADDRTAGIVEDVKTQLDQADARLEVASSRLSDQIDSEVNNVELNSQLEQRRAKLGLA